MSKEIITLMSKLTVCPALASLMMFAMISARPLQDSLHPVGLFTAAEQARNDVFAVRTNTLQAIMDTLQDTPHGPPGTSGSSSRTVGDNDTFNQRTKKALFNEFPRLFHMIKEDKGKGFGKVETPYVECPTAEDGLQLFYCPTPDSLGEYKCIDDHSLCDSIYHCPNGEDEDRTVCMFHRMTMTYFSVLLDAAFGITRSIV